MRYTIIAGLNGVGKSTAYSILSQSEKTSLGKRINPDEIVSLLGDWNDSRIQFIAGRQAVREIKKCLENGCDFHQETTLAGQSIIKTVKKAKQKGFEVHLWYIYVDTVEIAKQRVRDRVASGGHGIPEEIIERRSLTSLKTLKEIVPLCNEVRLYDNTEVYNPTARIINGRLKILDNNIPFQILSCLQGG